MEIQASRSRKGRDVRTHPPGGPGASVASETVVKDGRAGPVRGVVALEPEPAGRALLRDLAEALRDQRLRKEKDETGQWCWEVKDGSRWVSLNKRIELEPRVLPEPTESRVRAAIKFVLDDPRHLNDERQPLDKDTALQYQRNVERLKRDWPGRSEIDALLITESLYRSGHIGKNTFYPYRAAMIKVAIDMCMVAKSRLGSAGYDGLAPALRKWTLLAEQIFREWPPDPLGKRAIEAARAVGERKAAMPEPTPEEAEAIKAAARARRLAARQERREKTHRGATAKRSVLSDLLRRRPNFDVEFWRTACSHPSGVGNLEWIAVLMTAGPRRGDLAKHGYEVSLLGQDGKRLPAGQFRITTTTAKMRRDKVAEKLGREPNPRFVCGQGTIHEVYSVGDRKAYPYAAWLYNRATASPGLRLACPRPDLDPVTRTVEENGVQVKREFDRTDREVSDAMKIRIETIADKAGLHGLSSHVFKHWRTASNKADTDLTREDVSKAAGHLSEDTTHMYGSRAQVMGGNKGQARKSAPRLVSVSAPSPVRSSRAGKMPSLSGTTSSASKPQSR